MVGFQETVKKCQINNFSRKVLNIQRQSHILNNFDRLNWLFYLYIEIDLIVVRVPIYSICFHLYR